MERKGDPALIGRVVAGKYVIESFLGAGAMGSVYRARQTALDKKVAVKILHPELGRDPAVAERFQFEARAASRLDHPNLLRVHDVGTESDGLLYIAMELLEGRSLYRVLHDDWPLPPARIIDLMMQTLAALAAAHEVGVIHRDLKPENIVVLKKTSDDGEVTDLAKVCDFGIAKLLVRTEEEQLGSQRTTRGLIVGTPEYMSPEQARGEPLDARSDLYSAGVVLYQLLTGRVPFTAETPLGVALRHVNDAPRSPSEAAPGADKILCAICMRALEKDPKRRFQSAREMRAELKAAASTSSSEQLDTGAPSAPESLAHAPTLAALTPVSEKLEEAISGKVPAPRRGRKVGWVVAAVLLSGAIAAVATFGGRWVESESSSAATPTASSAPSSSSAPIATLGETPAASAVPETSASGAATAVSRTRTSTSTSTSTSDAAVEGGGQRLAIDPATARVTTWVGRVQNVGREDVVRALAGAEESLTACYRAGIGDGKSAFVGQVRAKLGVDGSGTAALRVVDAEPVPGFSACASHAVSGTLARLDAGDADADVMLTLRAK